METNPGTRTATETETTTATATNGACAVGAGVAGLACKGMVVGFAGGLFAILGITGISKFHLVTGLLGVVSVLAYLGFRHAGRKAVAVGIGGLATMWWGYMLGGYLQYGDWSGAMLETSFFVTNPLLVAPVMTTYLAGTGLFLIAVYLAYLEPYDVSTGGAAGGIAVATMCSGSGVTAVAGGSLVALVGTTGVMSHTVLGVMALGGLGLVGLALHKRAFKQAGLITGGIFVGYLLPWRIMDHLVTLGTDLRLVVGTSLTYVGMGMMFLGLFWVYRPHMNLLPRRVRQASPLRALQASLKS